MARRKSWNFSTLSRPGLAILGISILLLTLFYTFTLDPSEAPAPSKQLSYANQTSASLSGRDPACQNELTTHQLTEQWHIQADTLLRIGDTGLLRITCQVEQTSLHTCDQDTMSHEVIRPENISVAVPLTVEGPFWSNESSTKATEEYHQNPLEWSWTYTADSEGEKKILITLPNRQALSEEATLGSTVRLIALNDNKSDDTSRFLSVNVKAEPSKGLFGTPYWLIPFLGWLIGSGLSLPYLIKLFSSKFKNKRFQSEQ